MLQRKKGNERGNLSLWKRKVLKGWEKKPSGIGCNEGRSRRGRRREMKSLE